jgi:hypothetical protein
VAKVKKKEHEKLTDENIRKVISLLESQPPITKKDACSILNIAYNTTRLQRIIDEFNNRQANIATRKNANRGKPASEQEIKEAIMEYLQGENITTISKRLYRSAGFVKAIIERIGVPQKPTSATERSKTALLPEACCSDEFKVGEVVWSAAYHMPAVIVAELNSDYFTKNKGMKPLNYESKYGAKVYRIHMIETVDAPDSYFPYVTKGGFSAASPAYDLGKLEHLKVFGVSLDRI